MLCRNVRLELEPLPVFVRTLRISCLLVMLSPMDLETSATGCIILDQYKSNCSSSLQFNHRMCMYICEVHFQFSTYAAWLRPSESKVITPQSLTVTVGMKIPWSTKGASWLIHRPWGKFGWELGHTGKPRHDGGCSSISGVRYAFRIATWHEWVWVSG